MVSRGGGRGGEGVPLCPGGWAIWMVSHRVGEGEGSRPLRVPGGWAIWMVNQGWGGGGGGGGGRRPLRVSLCLGGWDREGGGGQKEGDLLHYVLFCRSGNMERIMKAQAYAQGKDTE